MFKGVRKRFDELERKLFKNDVFLYEIIFKDMNLFVNIWSKCIGYTGFFGKWWIYSGIFKGIINVLEICK